MFVSLTSVLLVEWQSANACYIQLLPKQVFMLVIPELLVYFVPLGQHPICRQLPPPISPIAIWSQTVGRESHDSTEGWSVEEILTLEETEHYG